MTRIRLKDACESVDYGLTASAEWTGVGPKFIRITDIVGGLYDLSTVPRVSIEPDVEKKYTVSNGDILVARTGASVGESYFHNLGDGSVFASYLVRFRVNSDFDPRFVYYATRTQEWRNYISSNANAKSAQPNIGASAMGQFVFEVPGQSTQRAIGEVLGALDDKIAANRQVVRTSVTLATHMVAREAVGSNRPLSEIADVQMGSSPRGAELNEDGDGMQFFQGVRDFGELSPTPRIFATVTPRRAKAGDTLLAVRAPVGEVNWARNETCIGRGLAAVRSENAPTTIHYLLRRFAGRWDEHEGSGTVFSSVTGPQVKAMQFPTVPEASAGEVEQLLASIHQRALSAEAESEVLARTRDELLPLLMNGRIAVKDAERTAEDVL